MPSLRPTEHQKISRHHKMICSTVRVKVRQSFDGLDRSIEELERSTIGACLVPCKKGHQEGDNK
jgi:hypothetical protein